MKTNKNRTHRTKRNFRRTKNRKIQLKVFELNKKIAILEGSKNKIQNILDMENQKMSIIQQKIRKIRKYGEINSFDFNEVNQHDDEININEFLDLAENKKKQNTF